MYACATIFKHATIRVLTQFHACAERNCVCMCATYNARAGTRLTITRYIGRSRSARYVKCPELASTPPTCFSPVFGVLLGVLHFKACFLRWQLRSCFDILRDHCDQNIMWYVPSLPTVLHGIWTSWHRLHSH